MGCRWTNADLKYYVYILQCEGNKHYCGWTSRVINRFVAHVTGKGAKFTRGFPPVSLLHLERLPSYMDAVKRERRIKDMMRKGEVIYYKIVPEYLGILCIIREMLLEHDGPYVKRKLNSIEKGE